MQGPGECKARPQKGQEQGPRHTLRPRPPTWQPHAPPLPSVPVPTASSQAVTLIPQAPRDPCNPDLSAPADASQFSFSPENRTGSAPLPRPPGHTLALEVAALGSDVQPWSTQLHLGKGRAALQEGLGLKREGRQLAATAWHL